MLLNSIDFLLKGLFQIYAEQFKKIYLITDHKVGDDNVLRDELKMEKLEMPLKDMKLAFEAQSEPLLDLLREIGKVAKTLWMNKKDIWIFLNHRCPTGKSANKALYVILEKDYGGKCFLDREMDWGKDNLKTMVSAVVHCRIMISTFDTSFFLSPHSLLEYFLGSVMIKDGVKEVMPIIPRNAYSTFNPKLLDLLYVPNPRIVYFEEKRIGDIFDDVPNSC